MNIDMHFHISTQASSIEYNDIKGCAVSRKTEDNYFYLKWAIMTGNACALLADPESEDFKSLLELIRKKKAIGYWHIERFGYKHISLYTPLLELSETYDLPVILHLSRHDSDKFDRTESFKCLTYINNNFPSLKAIISHCGGENFPLAIDFCKKSEQFFLDTSRIIETSKRVGLDNVDELLNIISNEISYKKLVYGSDTTIPRSLNEAENTEKNIFLNRFSNEECHHIFRLNGETLLSNINVRH